MSSLVTRRSILGLVLTLAAVVTDVPAAHAAQGQITVLTPTLGSENWLQPNTDTSAAHALQPMYESLLYRDEKTGRIVTGKGRLAETWDMSADGLTYTFNLRKGVQFHGGHGEMTAADVKLSFELAARQDSKNPAASLFRGQVESVDIINPYRIVFRMKRPSIGLPIRLSEMQTNLGILSKKHYDAVGEATAARQPVGTGPYRFAGHDLGQFIRYEAVDKHWRQTPAIKTIVIRAVPNDATRLAMLKSGSADLATVGFNDVAEVEKAGLTIQSLENSSLVSFMLLGQYLKPAYEPATTPPWAQADPEKALKVRRALSLAINRKELVDYVLQGKGRVEQACAFSFVPSNVGFNQSCQPDPYDPVRAKQLLVEAGIARPADLQMTVELAEHPARPFASKVLEAVAQQWRTLGITVKTQKSEWRAFEERNIARRAIEVATYAAPAFDDAAELLGFYSRSTDRLSYTGESPVLEKLMPEALAAVNRDDVRKTREALFEYLYKNVPTIPVVYAHLLYAKNPKLDWPALPGTVAYYIHNYEYMSLKP
jgi:ABC-type transport system substrate-binding protein